MLSVPSCVELKNMLASSSLRDEIKFYNFSNDDNNSAGTETKKKPHLQLGVGK